MVARTRFFLIGILELFLNKDNRIEDGLLEKLNKCFCLLTFFLIVCFDSNIIYFYLRIEHSVVLVSGIIWICGHWTPEVKKITFDHVGIDSLQLDQTISFPQFHFDLDMAVVCLSHLS